MTKPKLTAKEEKFCQEYVKLLNKAKAAVNAGYSKKSAKEIAYETFTKPHIQARIEEIRAELKLELGIDDHAILSELAALGYWNIKDFISRGNKIKNLRTVEEDKLKPVVGIKIRERHLEDGTKEIITELKMVDKRAALVDLGRHLGIFEKDNQQKSVKIKVTRK